MKLATLSCGVGDVSIPRDCSKQRYYKY